MFSQLRHAVENIAQPAILQVKTGNGSAAADSSPNEGHGSTEDPRRSTSITSPTHLAESALLNLRKSLSQRPSSAHVAPPESRKIPDREHIVKPSLEDRLRASFTLGELSPAPTPLAPTPEPVSTPPADPVEPASIPLPPSPSLEPTVVEPTIVEPTIMEPTIVEPTIVEPTIVEPTIVEPTIVEPTVVEPNVVESTIVEPIINDASSSVLAAPEEQSSQEPTELPTTDAPTEPLSSKPVSQDVEEVERLRTRLSLVEERFTDVSTSFKRLQAEKLAADLCLRELTPVDGISDADGLREYLRNLAMKTEMSGEEIKRLHARLRQHDERMEELRDTHRLESSSQSDMIEQLRKQLSETNALLKASQAGASQAEDLSSKQKAEIEQLRGNLDKMTAQTKEEEEKRVKAISLLKSVRQKLVKAEKEREDAIKEVAALKEKEKTDQEREKAEVLRLTNEIERGRADREKDVANLRAQFERELAGTKERFDRESAARKGQYELEAITTKAAHSKELAAKSARITQLENSVRVLSEEKSNMFDQLQLRQAELESSQSHLESLQSQNTELQYQLREATDRAAILQDELADATRRGGGGGSPSPHSQVDVARILSEAEGKYEARLSDLRSRMRALEKERTEAEEEWSRNLQQRSKEVERLRKIVEDKDREYAESVQNRRTRDQRIEELEKANATIREERRLDSVSIQDLKRELESAREALASARQDSAETLERLQALENLLEEVKARESQLRTSNKTLREELRKVQSSAALLERQRNPGVGYWSSTPRTSGFPSSPPAATSSTPDLPSTSSSPRPGSPANGTTASKDEEEVNLEYLRNVILQFLEHKEMRPHLVRVLSTILRFTPQETRRLVAKV